MKFHSLLSIAALCAIVLFSSCKNDNNAAKDAAVENAAVQPSATEPANTAAPGADPTLAEPPQNATGLWHYTCPKGCAGGSGSAIACPTCGTTLTHSQTYHGSGSPTVAPPPTTISPLGTTIPAPGETPAAPQPEPAQNKSGVWHYTCPGGCAGGSGSASPCAKCGKTLVHNTAYHK